MLKRENKEGGERLLYYAYSLHRFMLIGLPARVGRTVHNTNDSNRDLCRQCLPARWNRDGCRRLCQRTSEFFARSEERQRLTMPSELTPEREVCGEVSSVEHSASSGQSGEKEALKWGGGGDSRTKCARRIE